MIRWVSGTRWRVSEVTEHQDGFGKKRKKRHRERFRRGIGTHGEEEVHDAGVQQRFPPGLGRLEHDILCGLEHGDVVAPQ